MDLFDWKKYIDNYEDLKRSNINTKELAFEHWVNHGQKEGRTFFTVSYDDCNDFDWKKYINHYQDLKHANIRSRQDALYHWINYGKHEQRTYFSLDAADKVKTINLIGIVDIKCSISDNLNMIKNYFQAFYNEVNIINYKNVDDVLIDELQDYIICLQPFEIIKIISFLKRFNIKPSVFWVWEFKYLPKIFYDQEKLFSKIYVPSNFCRDIFMNLHLEVEKISLKLKILDVKDTVMNHSISDSYINNILEKNKNKIKIGYCFDINSSLIRKNVLNLVKAFANFSKNNDNVILILKYRLPRTGIFESKAEQVLFNIILNYIDNNHIYGINFELSDMDLYRLYTYFDYYISPHMGEGYGLTIEENLILGNKIISTYYSGEKDFLDENDFYRLEHEEIEVTDLSTHPIYRLLPNYTAAYVSEVSIFNTLNHIFD
jgi:hypothetical protein